MQLSSWESFSTETLFNRLFSEWKNKLYARRNERIKLQNFFVFEISETWETRKFSFYTNHKKCDFSEYNIPDFCRYNILIFIVISSATAYVTLIILASILS